MRLALAFASLLTLACGSDAVVTGGFVEFQSSLKFSGTSGEHTQTLNPLDEPDIASLTRGCGRISLGESTAYVEAFDGTAGLGFTLEATLIDGATEAPLFSWAGLLEDGGRRYSFESKDLGFSDTADALLRQILVRSDPKFRVRYRFASEGGAVSSTLKITQHYTFETDASACQ